MATQAELIMFRNDFCGLIKFFEKMTNYYHDDALGSRNQKIFEEYAEKFSQKYNTLQINLEQYGRRTPNLHIFLYGERDFMNILSVAEKILIRVEKIRFMIGNSYQFFSQEEFKDKYEEFKPFLMKNEVYFHYVFDKVERDFHFRFNEKYGCIEIVQDRFMAILKDPGCQLCMHYAFKDGYDKTIDLSTYPEMYMGRVGTDVERFKGAHSGLRKDRDF